MTPWEVSVSLEAANWQAEQEQRRMLSLAWHIEALQRSRRLPSLASLLRPRTPAKLIPMEERRREFTELKAVYREHTARRSPDTDQGDPRQTG